MCITDVNPVVDAKLLCACRLAYVDPPGAERWRLHSDADKDAAFPFPFGVDDGEACRREPPDWPQEWQRWESVDGKDVAILGMCSLGIIVAFRGTLSPIYIPGVGLPRPLKQSKVRPKHLRAPSIMQALEALFEWSLRALAPLPLRAFLEGLRYFLSSKGFFESINDWLNNLEVALKPWQCSSCGPQVHSGWSKSFEYLWFNPETNHGLKNGLEKALKEKKQKIFVTGHSKGGALAFLAAKRIQDDRKDAQLCVRTFAAPKPGDERFADEYNRTITDTVCYEYGADIVPHLPPRRKGTKEVLETLLGTSSLWCWLSFCLPRAISGQTAFPTECDRYRHVGKRVYIPYCTSATLDARGHGEESRGWASEGRGQRAHRGGGDDPGQQHRGARSTDIVEDIDHVWLKTVKKMLDVSPLAFLLIGFDHAFSGKSGYASYIFSKAAALKSAR